MCKTQSTESEQYLLDLLRIGNFDYVLEYQHWKSVLVTWQPLLYYLTDFLYSFLGYFHFAIGYVIMKDIATKLAPEINVVTYTADIELALKLWSD